MDFTSLTDDQKTKVRAILGQRVNIAKVTMSQTFDLISKLTGDPTSDNIGLIANISSISQSHLSMLKGEKNKK